ncbi:MAG: hypothetical protein LBT18_04835 [Endomicrobium sp.]|jgi:hypothetical protein|nr:hypothetical protein [Endomicrobium sp.]
MPCKRGVPIHSQPFKTGIASTGYKETFFGIQLSHGKKCDESIELSDAFHSMYKNTDRTKLLDFMKTFSDYEKLKTLSTDDLAITYCERIIYNEIRRKNK